MDVIGKTSIIKENFFLMKVLFGCYLVCDCDLTCYHVCSGAVLVPKHLKRFEMQFPNMICSTIVHVTATYLSGKPLALKLCCHVGHQGIIRGRLLTRSNGG